MRCVSHAAPPYPRGATEQPLFLKRRCRFCTTLRGHVSMPAPPIAPTDAPRHQRRPSAVGDTRRQGEQCSQTSRSEARARLTNKTLSRGAQQQPTAAPRSSLRGGRTLNHRERFNRTHEKKLWAIVLALIVAVGMTVMITDQSPATAATHTVAANADTYTRYDAKTSNYGTATRASASGQTSHGGTPS